MSHIEYSYKGYEYRIWQDFEDDNVKMFHQCWRNGQEVNLGQEFYNHSPYRPVPKSVFERLVDNQILIDFVTS